MKRILLILFLLTPVFTRAQTASFTVSTGTVCQDSCVTLINTSIGTIDSIRWVIIGNTTAIPHNDTVTVCLLSAGIDSVKLYVYDTGRVDSSMQVLRIKHMPRPTITDTFPCGLKVADIYLSYKWYLGPGYFDSSTDYFILNRMSPTSFYVVVDSNGCLGQSNRGYVCAPVEVRQVGIQNHCITIFPNPATNELAITDDYPITNVSISNLLGQTLFSKNFNTKKVHLDVSNLPTGIYIVKVNGSDVRKFIKE